jgi:hypothetical protein
MMIAERFAGDRLVVNPDNVGFDNANFDALDDSAA